MTDQNENTDSHETIEMLLICKQELKQEENLLERILLKVDKQINALKIEAMHLSNTTNSTSSEKNLQTMELKTLPEEEECTSTYKEHELDLSINPHYQFEEEEEEDDDSEDDEDDIF